MIERFILYLVGFLVFLICQGVFINGIKLCMDEGMILNGFKKWVTSKSDFWSKPFANCIKCMASIGGAITFWPVVIYFFSFTFVEVFVFVFDICCLVSVNYYIYKKL